MSASERYTRQERLREVGPAGQQRISGSSAVVRGTQGAAIERAYLVGAGVGTVSDRADEAPVPFAHAAAFQNAAARAVGAGAWRALRQLRAALGAGSR